MFIPIEIQSIIIDYYWNIKFITVLDELKRIKIQHRPIFTYSGTYFFKCWDLYDRTLCKIKGSHFELKYHVKYRNAEYSNQSLLVE